MKIIVLIICIMFFIACRKEVPEELISYAGDYHLIYIEYSEIEFWTPDEIDNQVGLKVLDNKNIETYVDGDIFRKYKFEELVTDNEENIIVRYKKSMNMYITVTFHKNGTIELTHFPYDGKSNFFKR